MNITNFFHVTIHVPIHVTIHVPIPVPIQVPHFKFIEQPVPIHVDHPQIVPVVKEIQVPQPYVHKVKLVLQKVLVEQPAAPRKTIIVQESPRHHGWD